MSKIIKCFYCYAIMMCYSAEESIRLAEAKLRSQINGESDAVLVKANIAEIGGLN